MRRTPFAALALWLLVSASAARADTYNITATFFFGGGTGTGSFQTNGCEPVCLGAIAGDITNFTFTIDDDTFTTFRPDAFFQSIGGDFRLFLTSDGADHPDDRLSLFFNSDALFRDGPVDVFVGTFTVSPGIAAVPEPSAVFLLFTAVVAVAIVARRSHPCLPSSFKSSVIFPSR